MPWPSRRGCGRRNVRVRPGALALALAGACGGEPPPPPPDLLLVTIDTLRPDALACYGGTADVGTGICGVAEHGGRFVWAFSTAPATGPAVASILTSRYPSGHAVTNVNSTVLRDELVTVVELLADAGYDTAGFVANPVLGRHRNLHQGFALFDDRMNRQERNRGLVERTARHATRSALAWLSRAESPWFLWVHYQDPHGPYDPPGAGAPEEGAAAPLPLLEDDSGFGGIPAYQELPGVRSPDAYRARYDDEIRYVDSQVARLVEAALARGRASGVLVTADHGEAFGEDGYWFAHGHSLGIDQIRVPLLWRPPGGTTPFVHDDPVSLLDVAPTLLAAAGLPAPAGFRGRALSSGPDAAPRGRFFAEQERRIAVVDGARYYGRDREPLRRPVRDRISSGWVVPLPPRSAELAPGGAWTGYREPADGGLEGAVERHLAEVGEGLEPQVRELSPALREELRALGYAE